jgi:hypothetical protein
MVLYLALNLALTIHNKIIRTKLIFSRTHFSRRRFSVSFFFANLSMKTHAQLKSRTYGDYYFTRWGFFLTLLGTVLASIKGILTQILQTPIPSSPALKPRARMLIPALHPLDLLFRVSPLAFVQCVVYAHFGGESARLVRYSSVGVVWGDVVGLGCNGAIAFALNVVNFTTTRRIGAVGMNVAGSFTFLTSP